MNILNYLNYLSHAFQETFIKALANKWIGPVIYNFLMPGGTTRWAVFFVVSSLLGRLVHLLSASDKLRSLANMLFRAGSDGNPNRDVCRNEEEKDAAGLTPHHAG